MVNFAGKIEVIHANGKEAFCRLEDREEYTAFYTVCLLIAEVNPEDGTPNVELLIRSEAYKDMGTDNPDDDKYTIFHEERIPFSNLEEFDTFMNDLIEMYGEANIRPVIYPIHVISHGFPENYSIENLKELLDDTKETGDWSAGGGFGICIYDEY